MAAKQIKAKPFPKKVEEQPSKPKVKPQVVGASKKDIEKMIRRYTGRKSGYYGVGDEYDSDELKRLEVEVDKAQKALNEFDESPERVRLIEAVKKAREAYSALNTKEENERTKKAQTLLDLFHLEGATERVISRVKALIEKYEGNLDA